MQRRDVLKTGAAMAALGAMGACTRKVDPDVVRIVCTSGTTNLVLTQLIQDMGYLKALGLKPTFINVADGNKGAAALISGSADICPSAGFTQVLAAIARGAPMRLVAGGADKNFNALLSANPSVRTLKDLEGRSVGIGALGAQLHQTMIALFEKFGVNVARVRFANVGASTDIFKAVKAGVVDAGLSEAWLQPGSGLHFVEHGKTFESLPEYLNQAAFTSQFTIASKRHALERTLAAYARLYRFIMSGDSETAFLDASKRVLGAKGVEVARGQWSFYRASQPFAADLALDPVGVAYMQNLNLKTGTQKLVLPFDRVVDLSLAHAALAQVGHAG